MPKITAPIVVFASSFITIVSIDLLDVPIKNLQQLAAVILVVLLLFSRQFFNNPSRSYKLINLKWIMLLLANLLVYVLLLSSGGFYSPFLVLVHLFTLGIGFLLSLKDAMIFLFLAVAALLLNLQLDPIINDNFQKDPWSVILYIISFIAVLPLIHQLIEEYHLGEKVVDFIEQRLSFEEKKEETIFQELDEVVIVLNKKMEVLSVNHVGRTILQKTNAQIVFKPLLELFVIKDQVGSLVTSDALDFGKVAAEKNVVTKNGFFLSAPGISQPIKVDLHLRPVVGSDLQTDQVVLVIKEAAKTTKQAEKASVVRTTLKSLHDRMKKFELAIRNNADITTLDNLKNIVLMERTVQDIAQLHVLLEHPIQENRSFADILRLTHESLRSVEHIRDVMGVSYVFSVDDQKEPSETLVQPSNQPTFAVSPNVHGTYTGVVDAGWFKTALERLLVLAGLLAQSQEHKTVALALQTSRESINAHIVIQIMDFPMHEAQQLFLVHYGKLANEKALLHGSGIEGLLARLIIDQTSANLACIADQGQQLIFDITVPRGSLK